MWFLAKWQNLLGIDTDVKRRGFLNVGLNA